MTHHHTPLSWNVAKVRRDVCDLLLQRDKYSDEELAKKWDYITQSFIDSIVAEKYNEGYNDGRETAMHEMQKRGGETTERA